jgi:hypothetical protein
MPITTPAANQVVSALRAAVVHRIERTSLRQVAREVGVSPSGLDKFVNGATPYQKTRRKLEAWSTRRAASDLSEDPSPETVAGALRILAVFAPAARRTRFVDDLLEIAGPVLPSDLTWRETFDGYGEYMRAGDLEETVDETAHPN